MHGRLRCAAMRSTVAVVSLAAFLAVAASSVAGPAAMPALYKKCASLNARYPHGIRQDRREGLHIRHPVTNFKRNNKLYALAMSHNSGLDRRQRRDRLREGVNSAARPLSGSEPWGTDRKAEAVAELTDVLAFARVASLRSATFAIVGPRRLGNLAAPPPPSPSSTRTMALARCDPDTSKLADHADAAAKPRT